MNWKGCRRKWSYLNEEVLHLKKIFRQNRYSTNLDWGHFHSGRSQPEWPLYSTCRPPMTGLAGFWQDLTSKLCTSQQKRTPTFETSERWPWPSGPRGVLYPMWTQQILHWTGAVASRWGIMNMCDTWLYQPNKFATLGNSIK
jgi:hypothetical protein